ncbi:MAG: diacylglycerol/lipid kinase family protein, partial [Clostridia bacterium]
MKASHRIAAIINPVAGGGRAIAGWRNLREIARRNGDIDEYISEYPGHATEVARIVGGDHYSMAFAVGGDGTIHEVVNGLMAHYAGDGYAGPVFGTIPLGRGNDFARTFGLTTNPAGAWLAQSEVSGVKRKIDVGWVKPVHGAQTHFINMCGVGFDADAAASANEVPRILGGSLPYVLGVLARFSTLKGCDLEIRLKGTQPVEGVTQPTWAPESFPGGNISVTDRFLSISVGVGRYLAGGMMLLPKANPVDGLLDIMMVRSVGRLRVLSMLPTVFRGGHIGEPEVAYYRASHVTIVGDRDLNIHADGDVIGSGGAEFGVMPSILPVNF